MFQRQRKKKTNPDSAISRRRLRDPSRTRIRYRARRSGARPDSKRSLWKRVGHELRRIGSTITRFRRRFSWKLLLLRTLVYGTSAVALMLTGIYVYVDATVDAEDVRDAVKSLVEDQAGGRLDIGKVTFDPLTGASLKEVQYYPPQPGAREGEAAALPLANFEALEVHYSLPRILAGRIHVTALKVVGPRIHLRSRDGFWNFAPLTKRTNEAASSTAKKAASSQNTKEKERGSSDVGPLAGYLPAVLFLPFDIMARDIGIEDLRVDVIKKKNGKVRSVFITNGINVKLGMTWRGLKSRLWLNLRSPFEHPLRLEMTEFHEDSNGKGQSETVLLSEAALNTQIEISNLKTVQFDLASRLTRLKSPAATVEDVGLYAKLRMNLHDDWEGFDLRSLKLNLADAAIFETKGKVYAPGRDLDLVNLKLRQYVDIDMQHLARLGRVVLPEMEAAGHVKMEGMRIEGPWTPTATKGPSASFPYISGALEILDVEARLPSAGLSLSPTNGVINLASAPAVEGGLKVDVDTRFRIPEVQVKPPVSSQPLTTRLEGVTFSTTGQWIWPRMRLPFAKTKVTAEQVIAKNANRRLVQVPFQASAEAAGDLGSRTLDGAVSLSAGSLVNLEGDFDYQGESRRFQAAGRGGVASFKKLLQTAKPVAAVFAPKTPLPEHLEGSARFSLSAQGRRPRKKQGAVAGWLSDGALDYRIQSHLTGVSGRWKHMGASWQGINLRLSTDGNLKKQSLELSHDFDTVSVTFPPSDSKAKDKPKTVTVEQLALQLNGTNDGTIPPSLAMNEAKLTSHVDGFLNIGSAAIPGTDTSALADMQMKWNVSQTDFKKLNLKRFQLSSVPLGTQIQAAAKTHLDKNWLPRSFATSLEIRLDHESPKRLPFGIRTEGGITTEMALETQDMRRFSLAGGSRFRNFHLSMTDRENPSSDPVFKIKNMNGDMPIKQSLDIASLARVGVPIPAWLQERNPQSTEPSPSNEPPKESPDPDASKRARVATSSVSDEEVFASYHESTRDRVQERTNVAALVNYGSIQEFFPGRRPLTIKAVKASGLTLKDLEFDIEVRQNWFALNRFTVGFLGGKINGNFQLAFDPRPQSLRTTVHITRLDTRKLLESFPDVRERAQSWNLFDSPEIDGSLHFRYDLTSDDMSGGAELSTIGKEQLRMILYYIDPHEKNPTIGDLKNALAFGEVRQVSVPIKNGEIGMDVDLRVLGAPVPTPRLTRFPISQIIRNFRSQMGAGGGTSTPPAAAPQEAQS